MCPNWPTCEYSHHTQLLSLSGGLKLRNLLLATMELRSMLVEKENIDDPEQPTPNPPATMERLHFEMQSLKSGVPRRATTRQNIVDHSDVNG